MRTLKAKNQNDSLKIIQFVWHIWDCDQVSGLHLGSLTPWCALRADVREGHGELLAYDETRPDNVWCSVIPDSVLTEMLKCMLAQCVCVGSIMRDWAGPPPGKGCQAQSACGSARAAAAALDGGLATPLSWPCLQLPHALEGLGHQTHGGGNGSAARQWVSCSQLYAWCLEQHLAHRRHSEPSCCMSRPHLRRWEGTRFLALITLRLGVATEFRADIQPTEGARKYPRQPPPLLSPARGLCYIHCWPRDLCENSCFSPKAVN